MRMFRSRLAGRSARILLGAECLATRSRSNRSVINKRCNCAGWPLTLAARRSNPRSSKLAAMPSGKLPGFARKTGVHWLEGLRRRSSKCKLSAALSYDSKRNLAFLTFFLHFLGNGNRLSNVLVSVVQDNQSSGGDKVVKKSILAFATLALAVASAASQLQCYFLSARGGERPDTQGRRLQGSIQ